MSRDGAASDAATWCDQHDRRECSKDSKRTKQRCHQPAIKGLDACKTHCGERLDAAKARGQANLLARAFASFTPDQFVDHGQVLQWALTRAYLRSLWVAAQIRALGEKGASFDDEQVRMLMALEQIEAREAARVAKMAHDAGIDERAQNLAERTAGQLVSVLRGVITELGHDPAEPGVAAVVRRHLTLVTQQGDAA